MSKKTVPQRKGPVVLYKTRSELQVQATASWPATTRIRNLKKKFTDYKLLESRSRWAEDKILFSTIAHLFNRSNCKKSTSTIIILVILISAK